jgi:RHS repeat-associated protein
VLADPPHLSRHQSTPSTSPLSSSCFSHRSARLQTSNPSYHRNQQYSIIGLTNAAGTLVERYSYTAYGTLGIYDANGTVRTTSTYANRYTYTGREYDPDLNLYHFRARWYDPSTGGFISRDPLGYVDGMSLYRGYFGVRSTDPNGTRCLDKKPFCKVVDGPKYNIAPKDGKTGTPRVPWVHENGESSAPFELSAKFLDDPKTGAECRCCQVRQYIKWTKDFVKSNNGNPTQGFDPNQFQPDTWYEDRDYNDDRYGHRDGTHSSCGRPRKHPPENGEHPRIDDYFDLDIDNPSQLVAVNCASGCVYYGNDRPGGKTAAVKNLRGELHFKLEVIDTCNEDDPETVVATSGEIVVSFDKQNETEEGVKR